jgi:phosphoglycolate phosphatase-like HAD superfamily hydrolase
LIPGTPFEGTTIHPSTQKVLRTLKEKELKLGIITSKYHEPVVDMLFHFRLSELLGVLYRGNGL